MDGRGQEAFLQIKHSRRTDAKSCDNTALHSSSSGTMLQHVNNELNVTFNYDTIPAWIECRLDLLFAGLRDRTSFALSLFPKRLIISPSHQNLDSPTIYSYHDAVESD